MDTTTLSTLLADWGEPGYRARQAREAQLAGAGAWDEVATLPKALRERLRDTLPFWALTPHGRLTSVDGTVKWRLRAADGVAVETVLIPHARGRSTVCVSCQAGCALGCVRMISHTLGEPLKTCGASIRLAIGMSAPKRREPAVPA